MRGTAPLLVAGCVALALVAAAGTIASQRQRGQELSPLPSVDNGGPRGLAAARAWLDASGRAFRVLRTSDARPREGEVLLILAPASALDEGQAAALLAHAERGGIVVWAMGGASQPALEGRLGVARAARASGLEEHTGSSLAPHPLFDGISLRTGGATLRTTGSAALPVAGDPEHVTAASIPVGAGEAVVLSGADALENFRLGSGDNLALLSRLAAIGPIAFDERWSASLPSGAAGSRGRAGAPAAQALIAAAVLLLALGRRLGAVRAPSETSPAATSRDYLASLAGLYRRAGAAPELRSAAWRSLRQRLDRGSGIAARIPDDEVAERLAVRSPTAARAYERGLAALRLPANEASFVALSRAAGELDAALARRRAAVREVIDADESAH